MTRNTEIYPWAWPRQASFGCKVFEHPYRSEQELLMLSRPCPAPCWVKWVSSRSVFPLGSLGCPYLLVWGRERAGAAGQSLRRRVLRGSRVHPGVALLIFMPLEDKNAGPGAFLSGRRKLLPCMSPLLELLLGDGHSCHGPLGNS